MSTHSVRSDATFSPATYRQSIAEMFGVQLATFGDDGTGALPNLLA